MLEMLRHERRLSVLLAGNALSQMGDGAHEFIFIITVLHVTQADVVLAGAIYCFRFIPYIVLGPLGGALAERRPCRALIIGADVARMFVTVAFCALLSSGRVSVIALAFIGMTMTGFRAVFHPVFQSAIAVLARPEHRPTAGAATQFAADLGGVVGPTLGGALFYAVGDAGYVLVIDAVSYVVSALCIGRAIEAPVRSCASASNERFTPLCAVYREFAANLKAARVRRELFMNIGYSALCILFVGAALRVFIPMMLASDGFADSIIGYAMSALVLGAVVGAHLCGRLARNMGAPSLMACWRCYGFMLALLPLFAVSTGPTLAGCFMLGAIGAFVDVVLSANIQRLSGEAHVGKNFSVFSTLAHTSEALSGALAGALSLVAPVAIGVSVVGIAVVALGCVGGARSTAHPG